MLRKLNVFIFTLIGLGVAYAALWLLVLLTRGKFSGLLRKKISVGLMIITFSSFIGTGSIAFSQEATATPGVTPVYGTTPPDLTIGPTEAPTATPGPTAVPTATPIPDVTTPEPTVEPSETPVILPVYGIMTAEPTVEPAETPVILPLYGIMTPEPSNSPSVCTCVNLCDLVSTISPDFSQDGAGEYCWDATSIGNYINSWNLDLLSINGVDCTNKYVVSSTIPSQDGKYYVYYKASFAWSHFEMKN